MDNEAMAEVIVDNRDRNRYEILVNGELAGYEEYTLEPGVVSFNHTVVLPAFENRGLARRLVSELLDRARDSGLAVLPYCPYVASFIRRNPAEYLDLVPEDRRAEFTLPA
jgi:uncharacterized protein